MKITIPNGFVPRPYQRRFMSFMDRGGRAALWVVHRRGGKDLTCLHQTCKAMHQRRGVYWHIFPTAEQARKAIWEGFTSSGERIMEQVFPRAIRKSPRQWTTNGEMVVELKCGSIWRLMGSDKMEVVGAGPVGVVFSEYALSKPSTWNLVRPMLRENKGWVVFATTPRGHNHCWDLYQSVRNNPSWFVDIQTLRDTMAYDPDETIAEERASGMPEALIQQEYFCDWSAALVGSVWGDAIEQIEKRGDVAAFDLSTKETFTTWDLGHTDSTAIWWWQVNRDTGGIDVVDHYEAHGQGLKHYFGVIWEKLAERGYRYAKHWLPHDARARTLASTVSIQEQAMAEFGSGFVGIVPNLDMLDGIQAGRRLLSHPKTRFHARCREGVEALKAYRYAYDEERKTFSPKPVHDWSSHTNDALRYLSIVAPVSEVRTRPEPVEAKPSTRTVDSFTLDELIELE